MCIRDRASTAFAFPHILSGPLLARNATMMFSPPRLWPPQEACTGPVMADRASIHDLLHPVFDVKSDEEHPGIDC